MYPLLIPSSDALMQPAVLLSNFGEHHPRGRRPRKPKKLLQVRPCPASGKTVRAITTTRARLLKPDARSQGRSAYTRRRHRVRWIGSPLLGMSLCISSKCSPHGSTPSPRARGPGTRHLSRSPRRNARPDRSSLSSSSAEARSTPRQPATRSTRPVLEPPAPKQHPPTMPRPVRLPAWRARSRTDLVRYRLLLPSTLVDPKELTDGTLPIYMDYHATTRSTAFARDYDPVFTRSLSCGERALLQADCGRSDHISRAKSPLSSQRPERYLVTPARPCGQRAINGVASLQRKQPIITSRDRAQSRARHLQAPRESGYTRSRPARRQYSMVDPTTSDAITTRRSWFYLSQTTRSARAADRSIAPSPASAAPVPHDAGRASARCLLVELEPSTSRPITVHKCTAQGRGLSTCAAQSLACASPPMPAAVTIRMRWARESPRIVGSSRRRDHEESARTIFRIAGLRDPLGAEYSREARASSARHPPRVYPVTVWDVRSRSSRAMRSMATKSLARAARPSPAPASSPRTCCHRGYVDEGVLAQSSILFGLGRFTTEKRCYSPTRHGGTVRDIPALYSTKKAST